MNRFLDLGWDEHSASMLSDAYETIASLNLWDTLRVYDAEVGKGYMFAQDAFLMDILNGLSYTGHSGSSWAWTMRSMELIAKNGWDAYAQRTKVPLEESGSRTSAREAVLAFQATQSTCSCRRARGAIGWCEATPNNLPRCEDPAYPPPSSADGLAFLRMGNLNQPPCSCRAAQGFTWGWCGVAGEDVPKCEQ